MVEDVASSAGCAPIELVRTIGGGGLESIVAGRADVVLATEGASPAEQPLFDDRLVGVVGASHRLATREALAPEDFSECDYATYSTAPQAGFEHATFFAPHRIWPRHILRVESVATLLALLAGSDRMSVLPSWSVPPNRRDVVTIPLIPEPPSIHWYLVSRDLTNQVEIQATVSTMAETLRRLRPLL